MAKGYELEGKILLINDIQTFNSGFTKREFVVETQDGNYPQQIKFECVKDRTSLTDGFSVGDPVVVNFDIRGNEYNGRYYVNLNAWKLDKAGDGSDVSGGGDDVEFLPEDGAPASHLQEPPAGHGQSGEGDDIPF